jgi:hypothetical protein
MVQELKVHVPEKKLSWEEQSEFLYEYAVEGIPLPEKMDQLLQSRIDFTPGDRDPAMVKAEREWDAYFMGGTSGETPRERLTIYFKEVK